MNKTIKENLDKYVHVHADYIPVKGAEQSAFYNVTRNEITLFPGAYYDVLDVFKTGTLRKILDDIATESQKNYFMKFMEFLIDNEFIVFLEDPPPVQNTWDTRIIIKILLQKIQQARFSDCWPNKTRLKDDCL